MKIQSLQKLTFVFSCLKTINVAKAFRSMLPLHEQRRTSGYDDNSSLPKRSWVVLWARMPQSLRRPSDCNAKLRLQSVFEKLFDPSSKLLISTK